MKTGDCVKRALIGKSLDLSDQRLFQKLSLIALLAWIGLGADGLSSSCYGPESAFLALQGHTYLSIFVALMTVATIFIICASYSQLIELFPAGGGGYLVATKLISPAAGLVSGCALIIDYLLTITISVASGADALFSLLPVVWQPFKLPFAIGGVVLLTLLNLRGAKESILFFVPIFALFVVTHIGAIVYALVAHGSELGGVVSTAVGEARAAHAEIGLAGMLLLVLRAYSMGAGTYTGIETVSNGMPILREPRVATGKRTMRYMAVSLAVTVGGLLVAYLLYRVQPESGKTLNAVLFHNMVAGWPPSLGWSFVLCTLVSEAALLFVAAQAGFVGAPRVLANMALDRWFPTRFATLSDRFVMQNGILLMGLIAIGIMVLTHGSVALLVVLYSINVFITFTLSQLGMVRHWWLHRKTVAAWRGKLLVNGIGFGLTLLILVSLSIIKFWEGGWITLLVTGLLIGLAVVFKRHYVHTARMLRRLDSLMEAVQCAPLPAVPAAVEQDSKAKTAILLVSGYNGLGLHTLFTVLGMFPGLYRNFVFLRVGVVDAGNFKGAAEIERLRQHAWEETGKYVAHMQARGFYAEAQVVLGTDVVTAMADIEDTLMKRFPQAVFFGGQLVFSHESWMNRVLHNYVVFALQRRFFHQGIPFLILPIRVQ